jgi:hypothetical protein
MGRTSSAPSLPGRAKDPVDGPGQDGHGVKAADRDPRHHLGDHGADLDPQQGAQEHAHGQGVEDEAVNGVLADGGVAGGENDLKYVGAHGGHGGHPQDVNEDGESEKTAAHPHDAGGQAHQGAGEDQKHPGNAFGPGGSGRNRI